MDLMEAIKMRHSVRSYTDCQIESATERQLRQTVAVCNEESGLNIQLILNEPQAFGGRKAHYGKFRNVRNYLALVGRPGPDFQEKCGYFGEKIVLQATQLGLNTCWVALTYSRGKTVVSLQPGEKLMIVIAMGYGTTMGVGHKVKGIEKLSRVSSVMPDWFKQGMEAAQLAPTALNQQKFRFELTGDAVMTHPGFGFYTKLDMGIAKYHFEIGAGSDNWHWA